MIPTETEIILKTIECCQTAFIKLGSYEYIFVKYITSKQYNRKVRLMVQVVHIARF